MATNDAKRPVGGMFHAHTGDLYGETAEKQLDVTYDDLPLFSINIFA